MNLQIKSIDMPLILFLICYLLASIMSVDRFNSIVGLNLMISHSFITVLFLVLFYFLVSRHFNEIKQIRNVLFCLSLTALIILVANFINLIPINFNFVFSGILVNTFNFILLLGVIISFGFVLTTNNWLKKFYHLVIGFIFFISLIVLDKDYFLLLLIVSIFIFIILLSLKSKFVSNKLVIFLTAILFLVVIVLVVPVNRFTHLVNLEEMKLPNTFGYEITKEALNENFIFGVGPGNFSYSFNKYKPIEFNRTQFWQLGFTRNSSYFLEILSTVGFLSLLLLFIAVIKYVLDLLNNMRKMYVDDYKDYHVFLIKALLLIIFTALVLYAFINDFNFILIYFFFLFLGLGSGIISARQEGFDIKNKQIINFITYLGVIIIIIGVYFGSRLVVADFNVATVYAQPYYNEQDFQHALGKLNKATKYISHDNYKIKLALLNISQQQSLLANESVDQLAINENIIKNIDDILKINSRQMNDYLVLNNVLDVLYSLKVPVMNQKMVVNNKLIELDKNNPKLYIERALINYDQYLVIKANASELSEKEEERFLTIIEKDLEKSLQLKPDYVLGYYNLGLFYSDIGDEERALLNIEKAFKLDPSQKLVLLSLKKLYQNQDKVDLAIEVINQYIEFQPQDTDVLFELAKIYQYEDEGKFKEVLNMILEIDPKNVNAKDLLLQVQ